jgi:hypothetical protein
MGDEVASLTSGSRCSGVDGDALGTPGHVAAERLGTAYCGQPGPSPLPYVVGGMAFRGVGDGAWDVWGRGWTERRAAQADGQAARDLLTRAQASWQAQQTTERAPLAPAWAAQEVAQARAQIADAERRRWNATPGRSGRGAAGFSQEPGQSSAEV